MKCTKSSYKGSYAFTATGFIVKPATAPDPFAAVGQYKADGKGNITGSQTRNFHGAVVTETFTESYTVNPDCTGSSTKKTSNNITTNWNFVVLHEGKTILAIEADAGNVVTIRAERM